MGSSVGNGLCAPSEHRPADALVTLEAAPVSSSMESGSSSQSASKKLRSEELTISLSQHKRHGAKGAASPSPSPRTRHSGKPRKCGGSKHHGAQSKHTTSLAGPTSPSNRRRCSQKGECRVTSFLEVSASAVSESSVDNMEPLCSEASDAELPRRSRLRHLSTKSCLGVSPPVCLLGLAPSPRPLTRRPTPYYAFEYWGLDGQDDDVEVGEEAKLPSMVLMKKHFVVN